jgi:hypothetical protein
MIVGKKMKSEVLDKKNKNILQSIRTLTINQKLLSNQASPNSQSAEPVIIQC